MLYKSGINLYAGAQDFFESENNLVLMSAYIRSSVVEELNKSGNLKQIVVRWEIEDLVRGSSDLNLYHYCTNNGIQLFRNPRLHLKACWNYNSRLFFGSANYTARGLSLLSNYNYELCGVNDNISFEDRLYLNKILQSSDLIDDIRFTEIEAAVQMLRPPAFEFPEISFDEVESDHFLLSQLPMSLSPDDLYDVCINSGQYDALDQNCAAHDIALYQVEPFEEYSVFKDSLRGRFNAHPFVTSLKEYIMAQSTQSLRYGGVVNWIQSNTTTVPIPRRWDIKREQIVNILYTWICEFDERFTVDIPGKKSEVIFYNKV